MSLSFALIAFLQVVQPPTPDRCADYAAHGESVGADARRRERDDRDGGARDQAPGHRWQDDDEVWREAQPITAFRQFSPVANGDARFKTEAKVAYDNENFYAFIRMYDPHPDSILRLLGRRDVRVATDQIKIIIDSYHDRRTGYEFAVNPAGVLRDYAVYNDITEDPSWDGVWEAKTTVDSLGMDGGVSHSAVAAALRRCEDAHVRLRCLARH